MALMTSRVKVWRHLLGLTSENNNFDFDVMVIPGLESTCIEVKVAKIGLNDVKVTLDLESTILDGVGRVGSVGRGLADNKTNSAQLELGLGLSLAIST